MVSIISVGVANTKPSTHNLFYYLLTTWIVRRNVISAVSERLLTSDPMDDSSSKDDHMASRSQPVFTFPSEVKNVPINNGGLFCL